MVPSTTRSTKVKSAAFAKSARSVELEVDFVCLYLEPSSYMKQANLRCHSKPSDGMICATQDMMAKPTPFQGEEKLNDSLVLAL